MEPADTYPLALRLDGCGWCTAGSLAEEFCLKFRLPRSGRYNLRKFGTADARTLGDTLARKLQHSFDLWLAGDKGFRFTAVHVEAYEPGAAFESLLRRVRNPQLRRAQEVANVAPRLG